MNRSIVHRLTALLVAGAFGLGSGASAAAQLACPHHADAHGAPGLEALGYDQAHGSAHAADHEHEPGHAHPPEPGHTHGPAADGSSHGPVPVDHEGCNCVGPCQGSATPVASAHGDEHRSTGIEVAVRIPLERRAAWSHFDPYFLPFANGPPTAS